MSKFKTKTVELNGFVWNKYQLHLDRAEAITFEVKENLSNVLPATLTIQVPAEEKKVTITESEFDQAVLGTEVDYINTSKTWVELLKAKLFGGAGE